VKQLRLGVAILFGLMILLSFGTGNPKELPEQARVYIETAQSEYLAQNILTPILLTWRGFDTFGELLILFLATSALGYLSRPDRKSQKRATPLHLNATKVAVAGVALLQPLLFIFAVYIFSFGHLSPGGAFPGGVVLGSGFVLWILVHPNEEFQLNMLSALEAFCGIAYLILAVLGLLILGTFLDPGYLPFGKMGSLISVAALPLMYVFIGIKVGVEMIKIVTKFRS